VKDQNQQQRDTCILYRPLPELEDQQEMVIAAEVDVVLHWLGEQGYCSAPPILDRKENQV
jgi:hypothetical protein